MLDTSRVVLIILAAVAGILLTRVLWHNRDWIDLLYLVFVLLILIFYFIRCFFNPGVVVLNQMATYNNIFAVIVVLAHSITALLLIRRKRQVEHR